MYKKIVPIGSKLSFSDIVKDVQDYTFSNIKAAIKPYIEQYGVVTETSDGIAVGPEGKPIYAHASGITMSTWGTFVWENNATSITLGGTSKLVYDLNTIGATTPYQLCLNYNVSLSEPVSLTDGFYYPSGSGYTKQSPAYWISAEPIGQALTTSQIRIASGITNASSELDASAFYDARTPLVLNPNILDDATVFLKDRAVELNHKLTLNSGITVNGNAVFTGEESNYSFLISGINLDLYGNFNNSRVPNTIGSVISNFFIYRDITDNNYWLTESNPTLGWTVRALNGVRTAAFVADSGDTIPVYNSSNQFVGNIITTGETPTDATNFRLYDINADRYSSTDSLVILKWNYDDVLMSGVSAGSTSMATNPNQPFAWDTNYATGTEGTMSRYQTIVSGNLNGKYLYFPRTGNKYEILAHTSYNDSAGNGFNFTITSGLTSVDASQTQLDYDSQTPCKIIDDADTYILTIERIPTNLSELGEYAQHLSHYKQTHVLTNDYVYDPTFTAHLPTDATYKATIQATKSFEYGNVVRLNENYNVADILFSKNQDFDGTDLYNAFPNNTPGVGRYRFYNTIPFDLGGSASVSATAFGFVISITGWVDEFNPENNPHDFEILYTTGSKPDWTQVTGTNIDSSYTRIITTSRRVSVATIEHRQYQIAVWPRLNGSRATSTPIELSVTGGAGGVFPDNGTLINTYFDLKTYELTGIADNVLDATNNVVSPAISGVDINGITPSEVAGQVIQRTDDDTEFRVTAAYWYDSNKDKISIEVNKISGASSAVSGVCYVNTTKTGRRIARSLELPIDYQLTSAALTVYAGQYLNAAAPGIIRVYQDGLSDSTADYIEIENTSVETTQALDGTVQGNIAGTNFARTLIVDAYDRDGLNNISNITGEITVYARPLVISRDGDRTIPDISV